MEPRAVIQSVDNGPYAYKSRLGWCVVGPIEASDIKVIKCNLSRSRTPISDDSEAQGHHAIQSMHVKETTVDNLLRQMYLIDFNEVNSERKGISFDDDQFIRILEGGVISSNNLHYVGDIFHLRCHMLIMLCRSE